MNKQEPNINDVVLAWKNFEYLAKENGNFGYLGNGLHLTMNLSGFMKAYPEAKIEKRYCDTYPLEASTTIEGVKVFCIE